MPFTVSFDQEGGIVTVRVSGEATHSDHRAALEGAQRLCRENDCSRMLVDLRELNTRLSSTLSCYSFGESVAQACPGARIAHVLPVDAESRGDVEFVSTVETNRGTLTGEFASVEEARNWLLGRT